MTTNMLDWCGYGRWSGLKRVSVMKVLKHIIDSILMSYIIGKMVINNTFYDRENCQEGIFCQWYLQVILSQVRIGDEFVIVISFMYSTAKRHRLKECKQEYLMDIFKGELNHADHYRRNAKRRASLIKMCFIIPKAKTKSEQVKLPLYLYSLYSSPLRS